MHVLGSYQYLYDIVSMATLYVHNKQMIGIKAPDYDSCRKCFIQQDLTRGCSVYYSTPQVVVIAA